MHEYYEVISSNFYHSILQTISVLLLLPPSVPNLQIKLHQWSTKMLMEIHSIKKNV